MPNKITLPLLHTCARRNKLALTQLLVNGQDSTGWKWTQNSNSKKCSIIIIIIIMRIMVLAFWISACPEADKERLCSPLPPPFWAASVPRGYHRVAWAGIAVETRG